MWENGITTVEDLSEQSKNGKTGLALLIEIQRDPYREWELTHLFGPRYLSHSRYRRFMDTAHAPTEMESGLKAINAGGELVYVPVN